MAAKEPMENRERTVTQGIQAELSNPVPRKAMEVQAERAESILRFQNSMASPGEPGATVRRDLEMLPMVMPVMGLVGVAGQQSAMGHTLPKMRRATATMAAREPLILLWPQDPVL